MKSEKLNVAIVGAGTAGLMQAIALVRQFGQDVKISVFEKHSTNDWEQRGIELAVGPGFQIACRYLGVNIAKFCEEHGHVYDEDPAFIDEQGNRILEVEEQMKGTHTSGISAETDESGKPLYELRENSVHRRDLMNFIVAELERISSEEKVECSLNFGANIKDISMNADGRATLKMAGDSIDQEQEFDLVVGADGVHSKVRTLCLDKPAADILPIHIGANILYGFIPARPEFFNSHRFNISEAADSETGEKITLVMSGLKGDGNNPTTDAMWWAIIYGDPKNDDDKTAFWDNKEDKNSIKAIAEQFYRRCNHEVLGKLIELTPSDKFLYAGKFLERDYRDLKNSWGKNHFVLIGDAVHALMPWAGVGAGLAAEDAIILAELLKEANVLQALSDRNLFYQKTNEVFSRLAETRRDRVHYYTEFTRALVPEGILPPDANLENAIKDLNEQFGNQHMLSTSPFWEKLIGSILSDVEKKTFFYVRKEDRPQSSLTSKGFSGLTFWSDAGAENKDEKNIPVQAPRSPSLG